ncbi:MAG: isochorismatase family protein [Planctomycetes bacterium]|nr:isochorismatase family protein [Planctomycetota bacterium]MBL7041048.1 isochorismatase family protein [Pirellulaceae bacterium]
MMKTVSVLMCLFAFVRLGEPVRAEQFDLRLRYQKQTDEEANSFQRLVREEDWDANETAVIVCDVWDLHHCWNAARRLEEFGPRLNDVLIEARRRGAVVIHSPSDCMDAYQDHPARRRAMAAPRTDTLPEDIEHWCSRIPAEERANYPIDQSDGGEDDDPQEHAAWAAKLKALGRNPGMPWKTQSSMISIDAERDYISDRGDEVWNILEHRGIRNVILTGVHTNMCVLGRPFGLRQMSRNGKNVVLMRDMTDTMYNPKRWPYVDHFTANDLIVSHTERYVCPTITSDQLIGGKPFQFRNDNRTERDIIALASLPQRNADLLTNSWSPVMIPARPDSIAEQAIRRSNGAAWYRCAVRIRKSRTASGPLRLQVPTPATKVTAWCNGHPLKPQAGDLRETIVFQIDPKAVRPDDANLLVLRVEQGSGTAFTAAPTLVAGDKIMILEGRWQFRAGDDPSLKNMPLPARFGASTDILFEE